MPGTRPNPTASRRALAARLRRMRLTAGKSTDDAARELLVSPSKISRLESGDRMPQPRDVRDLARYYGASEQEVGQLQELVLERAGKAGGRSSVRTTSSRRPTTALRPPPRG